MKTNPYIIDYYNNYDEDSRLSPRHGTVEFLTTMRYIEKYIKPGSRVLEIGAGTGRYSHALARLGYTVDAVELVPHNIEVFCRHTLPAEHITITQGNALDLSAFSDNQYDITLLLGPLIPSIHKKTSARRWARPSASQNRAASSLQHMSYPTAVFWTKDSTEAISMQPNT